MAIGLIEWVSSFLMSTKNKKLQATVHDPWPMWPIQKWWPITHWPISISAAVSRSLSLKMAVDRVCFSCMHCVCNWQVLLSWQASAVKQVRQEVKVTLEHRAIQAVPAVQDWQDCQVQLEILVYQEPQDLVDQEVLLDQMALLVTPDLQNYRDSPALVSFDFYFWLLSGLKKITIFF